MLSQSYAPVVGGEERMVEDLSAELVARGHDVAVATLRQPAGQPSAVGADGVRVHLIDSSLSRLDFLQRDAERRHAPPLPEPQTTLGLRRVVAAERPDVIHAHNWIVHSHLPPARSDPPGLVLSLHDFGLLCATKRLQHRGHACSGPGLGKCVRCAAGLYGPARGPVVALATRLGEPVLRRRVDLFLPVSRAVEERCGLMGAPNSQVIPNFLRERAVAPPPVPPDDPRLAALPAGPFALFVGDMTLDKGAWHLARAHAALPRPLPLVLVGRCFIDGLAERPGVTVLGPWPRELVAEALRRCRMVLMPSVWEEPFGIVALEAAAAGRPIIASAIGGLRDIVVDEETGLLVAPGDHEDLARAIDRLAGDPALCERLGAAAARRVAVFGANTVVPAFEAAYRRAVDVRRAASAAATPPP